MMPIQNLSIPTPNSVAPAAVYQLESERRNYLRSLLKRILYEYAKGWELLGNCFNSQPIAIGEIVLESGAMG